MAHGIKETKEVLTAVLLLTKVIAKELKDGFEVKDLLNAFAAIQTDDLKKAQVEAALKGIVAVPDEVKDATLSEYIELAVLLLAELPALMDSFKKEVAA